MKHLNVGAINGKLTVIDPDGADFSWVEVVGLSNTPQGTLLVLGTFAFNFGLDLGSGVATTTPVPTPTPTPTPAPTPTPTPTAP